MGKVYRLISIVMILLEKDIVSATRLAEIFNVSKRTILRDMQALSLSKVPIYSINGANGGYGIMEEYKIDKRLLTDTDIENILAALNGFEQILYSEEITVTINKIQAMVRSSSQENTTQLSFYEWIGRPEILEICQKCHIAISQNRLVSFDYVDKNGASSFRTVEPYQLRFSEMSWYLKAFCLDRNDFRTFKLSRTENLNIIKDTFIPRDHTAIENSANAYNPKLVQIKVLISPSIKDIFIERYGSLSIEQHDTGLHATIDLPQDDIGFQFLAGFGTNLRVVEPKTYVDDFRKFLYEMTSRYT